MLLMQSERTMNRTHKICLHPNVEQARYFAQACGIARFAYNWGLDKWNKQYSAHVNDPTSQKPNIFVIKRELNAIKRDEFPWMLDVSKCVVQESLTDLGRAYNNFFNHRSNKPAFHKKGMRDSFRIDAYYYKLDGRRIWIPKLGWVRMAEEFRYPGAKLFSATISRRADHWYVSIPCQTTTRTRPYADSGVVLGIDVGVREYVASDGTRYQVPRAYRAAERRLRRAQQSLSRKAKGSNNRKKQVVKVERLHERTANIRKDWMHKLTNELACSNSLIGIEDLNVTGMQRNSRLAKSINDAAFGMFRTQLKYKADETGCIIVAADRFFPSSKTCNVCGTKTKSLPLSVREWDCPNCGSHLDRDLNAAKNLRDYAVSSTVSACGEFLASDSQSFDCQATSVKQEPINIQTY